MRFATNPGTDVLPHAADIDASLARSGPGVLAVPPAAGFAEGGRESAAGKDPRPSVRNRTVLVYLTLALVALLPGLIVAAKPGLGVDTLAGDLLARLGRALEDIRFGSGLRFWLGVTGASMLGLLLLYPLRKAIAGRRLGSIGAWFHLHILLGLAGPVVILYHCNFGLGALNANVALWSLLVIAASGIVGQFVYMRVNAGFYGERQTARERLDNIIAQMRALDGVHMARTGFCEQLELFDQRLLAPRGGVIATAGARVKIEMARRQAFREAAWILRECGIEGRWSQQEFQSRRRSLFGALGGYFASVRAASRRSILEQLWARWRLFHLPLFLVMVVAVILHVIAVWGMDDPKRASKAAPAAAPPAVTLAESKTAPAPSGFRQIRRQTVHVEAAPANAPATAPATADRIAELIASDSSKAAHVVAGEVQPPAAEPARPKPAAKPQPAVTPSRPAFAVPPVEVTAAPTPAAIAKLPPEPAPPPVAASPRPAVSAPPAETKPELKELYSELQRRTETQPMALGGAKPKSLLERIAELKAQRFDHNSQTKFPLTGRHTKLECASCHTKTLEGNPRECQACHQADDPHRGRRPECGDCHTTNRWSQITKRR